MINLFKRKTKQTEATLEAAGPTDEPPSADVDGATPESAGNPLPEPTPAPPADTAFWSYASTDDELIRVEEKWQDGALVVRAELPDIDPDKDVRLTVADGRLIIEAERHQADTHRARRLCARGAALQHVPTGAAPAATTSTRPRSPPPTRTGCWRCASPCQRSHPPSQSRDTDHDMTSGPLTASRPSPTTSGTAHVPERSLDASSVSVEQVRRTRDRAWSGPSWARAPDARRRSAAADRIPEIGPTGMHTLLRKR